MYLVIGKTHALCNAPECEYIADPYLGQRLGDVALSFALQAYIPDGLVLWRDDGTYWQTWRGELIPARAGMTIKTIPNPLAHEMDKKEYWQQMAILKKVAFEITGGLNHETV